MQIAPIPAFLAMDGFKKDIDAADLYERVLSIETEGVEGRGSRYQRGK